MKPVKKVRSTVTDLIETHSLVIGGSGGIAQAITAEFKDKYDHVHVVSRSELQKIDENIHHDRLDTSCDHAIEIFCQHLLGKHIQFSAVVCCVGVLHDELNGVKPEKKLEDIKRKQLTYYFDVNSITPALWLKHILPFMVKGQSSTFTFITARVGSISDNRLGGWYGYRASKASLNMLLKTAQVECARRYKQVSLVSYHPGTVDTELSKPFQGNVQKDKLFTPTFTAQKLIEHTHVLQPENAPYFIDWAGQSIDW